MIPTKVVAAIVVAAATKPLPGVFHRFEALEGFRLNRRARCRLRRGGGGLRDAEDVADLLRGFGEPRSNPREK